MARLLLRSALLCVLLAAGATAGAQNVVDGRTAQVIAYWEPGDVRIYEVGRVKDGRTPGRSNYRITLKVLDATDSTYVLEARFSDVHVEAELPRDPRSRDLMQRILKASEGLRVVCSTDETGVPLSLVNEQEVAEHVRVVLDHVLELATTGEERERMQAAFGHVLSTPVLAQGALEDIGNLLFAFGVEYTLDRTETVGADVPNPVGAGLTLRATQEFTMTALDTLARRARMRMVQHLDRKHLEEHIDQLVGEAGGEGMTNVQRVEFRELLLSMEVDDTMDIDIDLDGAWTIRNQWVRTVQVAGHKETDTRTYQLR